MKTLRAWQQDAIPHIWSSIDKRPLVRGVMGSGKSVLISELVAQNPKTTLITVPSVDLVDQIAATLSFWSGIEAGKFYTHAKDIGQVTVCCHNSLPELARHIGPVELWISDEAHKTETEDIKDAIYEIEPRYRIGFSATPWRSDPKEKLSLFDTLAYNYGPSEAIRDKVVVPPKPVHYRGDSEDLDEQCLSLIATSKGPGLVNAVSIQDAEDFAEYLSLRGVEAIAVHSRMSRAEKESRISALQAGEYRALVHVNMLAEGIDLPWLRWMCCRRPVASRVRFAQEVGRVLRAFPGKDHAVVYDPHDLFNMHSLDWEACLSGGSEEDPIKMPAIAIDFAIEEVRGQAEPQMVADVPVALIKPISSYLRRASLAFQCVGAIAMTVTSTHWRRDPVTQGQLDYLEGVVQRAVSRAIPEEHRRALECAYAAAHVLNKGDISDLIGILKAIASDGWPDLSLEVEG